MNNEIQGAIRTRPQPKSTLLGSLHTVFSMNDDCEQPATADVIV